MKWSHTRSFCSVLNILVLLVAFSSLRASAHEVSNASNPQVVIAVDITSPHCYQVKTVVSPQTHAILSRVRRHCPAGTTLSTRQIYQSEAIAHHKDYVVLPTKDTVQSVSVTTQKQIEQLLSNTKKHFSSVASHAIPHSDCGQQLYWDTTDYQYGTTYDAVLNYYVSTTCGTVILQKATVTGDRSDGSHQINFYGFDYSNYGGQRWGPPDCRWISTGNSVTWPSAFNNISSGAGGTFDFLMSADSCVGANWTTSMYPIN